MSYDSQARSNEDPEDLRASKEPVLITEHGRPSAYLLDVDDFETMQDRISKKVSGLPK